MFQNLLVFVGFLTMVVAIPPPGIPEDKPISFTYHVWFDKNSANNRALSLTVPANTNMFEFMKLASQKDPNYKFEHKFVEGLGRYITSVGGRSEVPSENKYWTLYRLPFAPTSAGNPEEAYKQYEFPCGVDCTHPASGEHILLWLRKHKA